jgi:hypothetical protein
MNFYYPAECYEAFLKPTMTLNESFIRNKRIYEARHFDALYAKFETKKPSPPKNYAWFAKNWGDVDIGYSSFVND